MFVVTVKFNRKTAVFIVAVTALLLTGIILMAGAHSKRMALETVQWETVSARTEKSRAAYLSQYGWEIETPALSETKVLIPRNFSEVMENYNALQLEQGFDLSRYCGMELKQYTYKVLNYGSGEDVVAQLYVRGGRVVGGDVHSTRLDGFMVGIKTPDKAESV